MPTVSCWGLTHPGKVRGNNEDNWRVENDLSVALVADGMGGAACGEVASALTVEAIIDYLRNPAEELAGEPLVREAIRRANHRVLEASRDGEGCVGMGSIIVLAQWNGEGLLVANVGDSRAYLWRNGSLSQMSYDQNLANELRTNLGLTDEQINRYPQRNALTMAIGTYEDILICVKEGVLEAGDRVLLCSDGLHGPLSDTEIEQTLAWGKPARETVEALIERANAAGGPDNITGVLLDCA